MAGEGNMSEIELEYALEMQATEDEQSPVRRLYAAVILQAYRDLDSKLHRGDAIYYFRYPDDSGFRDHAHLAGMDPDVMVERLEAMGKLNINRELETRRRPRRRKAARPESGE